MSEVMLSQLWDLAYRDIPPWFPMSRQIPMKSHARKYAQALGCDDWEECPPALYHLPDEQVRIRLLAHLQDDSLQPGSLKNMCNDVLALLHAGMIHGHLTPPKSPLHEWRGHATRQTHGKYSHRRGVYPPGALSRYALIPLPETLEQELTDYLTWCQDPLATDRSWKIRKRAITANDKRGHISRIAGYAVRVDQLPAELLTLEELCNPALLQRFAHWWLKRRQKSTDGIRDYLGTMNTIAKHWVKKSSINEGIRGVFASLPPSEEVHDKEALWLDLEEINLIGQSRYPLNPKRISEDHSEWVRWLLRHKSDPETFSIERRLGVLTNPRLNKDGKLTGVLSLKCYAVWAELSLILQLWTHRPLRARNIREMSLMKGTWEGKAVNQNLIPGPNGTYRMLFRGDELKVGRRGKKENRWEAHWPGTLLEPLHEWLTFWRPKVIPSPDFPYVFCNSRGRMYPAPAFTSLIEATTWEYTQDRVAGPVAMNPHQIRSLWGSQMGLAGLNVVDLARLMGDNLQMVYDKYILLQQKRVISQWTKDLAKAIGEGTD